MSDSGSMRRRFAKRPSTSDPFLQELMKESDRAAVVLGASRVDENLCQYMQKCMRPSARKDDELFGRNGPLGNFGARITLARRLGLIDNDFAKGLRIIRDLRNDFAHKTTARSLDHEPYKSKVKDLVHCMGGSSNYSKLVADVMKSNNKIGMWGGRFRIAILLTAITIETIEKTNARALVLPKLQLQIVGRSQQTPNLLRLPQAR